MGVFLKIRSFTDCCTVDAVKALIKNQTGMPKKQQRLNFNEKQLEDGMTLSNYEIIDGSVIQLALWLAGGVGVLKKTLEET